jgi:protein arginine kinase activator
MLCEKCKKNQATVHMKQVINGDVKEMYLCSDCAEKAGLTTSFSFNDMFKDLFNVTADSAFLGSGFDSAIDRCPVCGQTYSQFRQNGKLGCGECIKHFGPYMDSVLKSIHGSSEHKGKIPHKSGGAMAAKREKELLKRKLAAAIENEEFEEAAKLRDRIRSLEKDGE